MHEIKSPFLILMEEQSYLAQSLESAFEKQNVEVKIVTIAETGASSIVISEKPSGYLICTSPELLKKAVSVKVMVDQAIKNKTPVFIMGNIDEHGTAVGDPPTADGHGCVHPPDYGGRYGR